ncbi:MAG: ERCC4 domain-containing protein [Nitrososphaerales archaeon]
MTKETVRIVADERERQSGIPDELVNLKAVVDFAQLQVGDYIVASDSAVERKSLRDLVQSIYDGRLFAQCSELVTHYAKPVLIVEGSNEMFERVIDNPMVIYGALASVALDFRIAVIHTPSASHTAKALIAMANRALKGKSGPLLRKVKKSNPLKMQQLSILASLPGVGDKLAVRLLTKFKTPMKVLNASTAELARVEGMGLARATKLRKVLDQVQVDSKNEQTALDGYET